MIKRMLLVAAALLTLSPASQAKDKKRWVIGAWKGVYQYSNPDGVGSSGKKLEANPFELFFIQKKNVLEGHIAEPNTFGRGAAPHLVAALKGSISDGGALEFIKMYDGTGEVEHAVHYRGTVSADGRSIEGTWSIPAKDGVPETTGTFAMEAVGDL